LFERMIRVGRAPVLLIDTVDVALNIKDREEHLSCSGAPCAWATD
jgi:hypothetical protein